MTQRSLPVGNIVRPITNVDLPQRTDYIGKFITLSPIDPQVDIAELYECSHGSDIKEHIWTYMSYGPFDSTHSMQKWLAEGTRSNDPLFFTVHHHESKQRIGMVSFLNIVSDMRRLELGHLWYSPNFQRSNVNTEAIYLMLCEAFDLFGITKRLDRISVFRFLSFFDGLKSVVLSHAFAKQTRRIPRSDIRLAEDRKQDYIGRKKQ